MRWFTHVICTGILVYCLLGCIHLTYAGFCIAIISSVIPDYLEALAGLRHRSPYIHNILIPLVAMPLIADPTLAGFTIGYLHHLILDALTRQGVFFGRKRIRWRLLSNNPNHNLLILITHILILIFFIYY